MPIFRPSDETAPKRGEVIRFPAPARAHHDGAPARAGSREATIRSLSDEMARILDEPALPTAGEEDAEKRPSSRASSSRTPEPRTLRDHEPEHAGPVSTPADVVAFPGASGDAVLLDTAQADLVRALARAPKSLRESRGFLTSTFEELGELDVERIIERLVELGYLDDRRLAEQLRDGAFRRKALGRRAKERELQQRGIASDLIAEVLAEDAPEEEFEQALELARERLRRSRGLDEETARRRIHGYLARRGYSGEVAGRAIRTALDE